MKLWSSRKPLNDELSVLCPFQLLSWLGWGRGTCHDFLSKFYSHREILHVRVYAEKSFHCKPGVLCCLLLCILSLQDRSCPVCHSRSSLLLSSSLLFLLCLHPCLFLIFPCLIYATARVKEYTTIWSAACSYCSRQSAHKVVSGEIYILIHIFLWSVNCLILGLSLFSFLVSFKKKFCISCVVKINFDNMWTRWISIYSVYHIYFLPWLCLFAIGPWKFMWKYPGMLLAELCGFLRWGGTGVEEKGKHSANEVTVLFLSLVVTMVILRPMLSFLISLSFCFCYVF